MAAQVINRCSRALARTCLALPAVALALFALASPAQAVISGPCTASGTASSSGNVDFTTQTVWHLKQSDTVSGTGHSEPEQTSVGVSVVNFGVPIPVFSSSGKGHGGDAGPFTVAAFTPYARVAYAYGASDSCSGSIEIIVDDVNPVATAAGGGGLALGVLGLLGMIGSMFGRGGVGNRMGGGLSGLIAGVGFGLYLEQAGVLDPSAIYGLALPLGGLVLGIVLAGAFGRGRRRAPEAPPA